MPPTTRRQFVQRTATAAMALCASRLGSARHLPGAAIVQNGAAPIDAAAIRRLSAEIAGQVITPATPVYDTARQVFNRAFDRHPALIVRCAGASDVARALAFVQRLHLPVAVRGGGHSRAGFGVCNGGVVIDLAGMHTVDVDAKRRVARAAAGALARDVDTATQRVGLATVMGGCPTVGVAGLTMGGGEGLLMSKYGATCDNLLSAQVVTVDGRRIEASHDATPDLFWAIRGGGGNFGVVTALSYRLHPLTTVLAGTLTYPPGRIPELLQAFVQFVSTAPDEMNVVGEVLPSVDGPRFHMLVCHCGDARHGTDLLAPLRALAPSDDRIGVASYLATQATINPYTAGAHFQTNLFLPTLTSDAITTINAAATAAPPGTRVFIVPLYGAISRVPAGDTAFPLRSPGYELDIMGRWSSAQEEAATVRWVKNLRDTLQPLSKGVYSNQLGETSDALVRAAYGPNYARLAMIKRKFDPANVLRLNQNIDPNSSS